MCKLNTSNEKYRMPVHEIKVKTLQIRKDPRGGLFQGVALLETDMLGREDCIGPYMREGK